MNDSGLETASSIAPGLSGEICVSDDAHTISANWIVELGLTLWWVLKDIGSSMMALVIQETNASPDRGGGD
ncbi:hypothetical protein, partial [Stenotrophomonas sepilia]